jgi:uncharacterized membrane protein YdjX (TVP38/TMEM64 family)
VLKISGNLGLPTIIRGLILICFLAIWVVLYHCTDYSQYLTEDKTAVTIEAIRGGVAKLGILGSVLFVVAGFLAIVTNIPALIIICLSVIIFGKVVGVIISTIIICIGITLIYFIAQSLGRDVVKQLFGKKLRKIEARLVERGIMAVVYLRLLFFMSPALNWLLSVTNISYKNFFFGTLLGTAPNIILFAWLSSTFIGVIQAGESLNPLKTPELLLPICVGIIILLISRIINRRRRNKVVMRGSNIA